MLDSIFHDHSLPAERPLDLSGMERQSPVTIIRRRVRRDPGLPPGDEIYDRARVIFSRARRTAGSRASGDL